jgi:hypothetical protein
MKILEIVTLTRYAQTPDALAPGRRKFAQRGLIFVGPHVEPASCYPYGAYNFEVAAIFLENWCTFYFRRCVK